MSLIVACGDEGARGDAAGTSSSSPTTTASDTTSSTPPGTAPGSTLVMASPTGVEVLSAEGDSTHISARPAGGAYAVGTDLVVFQGADPGASRAFPLDALLTVEVGIDTYRDLTLRNGEITLIQSTFDSADAPGAIPTAVRPR